MNKPKRDITPWKYTNSQREIFNIFILGDVYQLCNNNLFDNEESSEYVRFFNLRKDSSGLTVLKGAKIRVFYLIWRLQIKIGYSSFGETWASTIIKKLGYDFEDYMDHRATASHKRTSKKNQDFRKKINQILDLTDTEEASMDEEAENAQ